MHMTTRKARRKLVIPITLSVLLLLGGVAAAVLLVRANMNMTSSTKDISLEFVYGATAEGAHDSSLLPTDVFTTDGTCDAQLTTGELDVQWQQIWTLSICQIGANGPSWMWLYNPGTDAVTVTGLDFTDAPGYGVVGSGEPIIVTLTDEVAVSIAFPFTLDAGTGMKVMVRLNVDGLQADPGSTYGPATIHVNAS